MEVLLASGESAVSAEHRKPIVAFVLLAFAAATLIGIQSADAQGGRLMAAVIGGTARVHGSLPFPAYEPPSETVADLGPVFEALHADPAPRSRPRVADRDDAGSAAIEVQRAVTASVPASGGDTGRAGAAAVAYDAQPALDARSMPSSLQRADERTDKATGQARAKARRAAAKVERSAQSAERAAGRAAERDAKAAARAARAAKRAVERASSAAEKTLRDLGRTIGSFKPEWSYSRTDRPGRSGSTRSARGRDDDRGGHDKRAVRGSAHAWGDRDAREPWTSRDRSDRVRGHRAWGDHDRRSWGEGNGSRHGWGR